MAFGPRKNNCPHCQSGILYRDHAFVGTVCVEGKWIDSIRAVLRCDMCKRPYYIDVEYPDGVDREIRELMNRGIIRYERRITVAGECI